MTMNRSRQIPWLSLLILSLLIAPAVVACGGSAEAPSDGTGEEAAAEMPSADVDEAPQEPEAPPEPTAEPMANDEGGEGQESDAVSEAEPEEPPADDAQDAAADGPVTFVVDPTASEARYSVGEEFFSGALDRLGIQPGVQDTVGTTPDVTGQLVIEPGDPPSLASGQIVVGLRGLSSDQERRDNRVRDRILNTVANPEAVFQPTAMEGFPEGYTQGATASFQLVGNLTLLGTTQPVTFDVEATYTGDAVQGTATSTVRMSDFGIQPPSFANVFSVEDQVTIIVELVARSES